MALVGSLVRTQKRLSIEIEHTLLEGTCSSTTTVCSRAIEQGSYPCLPRQALHSASAAESACEPLDSRFPFRSLYNFSPWAETLLHFAMAKHKKRRLDTNHHDRKKPGKASEPQISRAAHKKSPKSKPTKKPQPTIPFQAEDRILLVGEGDFSFSKSIVEEHGCCDITATCLDSKEELFEKYTPQAQEHVTYLEQEGQTVLYNVDATKLDKNKTLQKAAGQAGGQLFEIVLFNFPHVGGKSTDVNRQVRFNQELLVSFFRSVQPLLSPTGTIVVTLFDGEPYTLWNIRDLARHTGLEVQRSFKFLAEAYPGYSHVRTLGNIEGGGGWKGEDRESRSFVFRVKGEKTPEQQRKERLREMERAGGVEKRKRGKGDVSSSEDEEDS